MCCAMWRTELHLQKFSECACYYHVHTTTNKAMIELKNFAFQVEQMRMAQKRIEDLHDMAIVDVKAIEDMNEMSRQLEIVVDDSLKLINNQLQHSAQYITVEIGFQDAQLKLSQDELEAIQKESVDQAIIDAKAGAKSQRYIMLEQREIELKKQIAEREKELGITPASPTFASAVSQVVNSVKP
jgi:hypothetical protein